VAEGFETFFKAEAVSPELGCVFGFAIVCKKGGADYVDVQGNHVPEGPMLQAVDEFMKGERMASEQHARMNAGEVRYSFPLTTEIGAALGIACDRSGWLVGVACDDQLLKRFKAGELTGFSVGGHHIEIDGKPVQ
jgi:hypothetical protein